MKSKLHDYRKLYQKHQLLEEEIPQDPFELFHLWIEETKTNKEVEEINTMDLSTIGLDGFPRPGWFFLRSTTMRASSSIPIMTLRRVGP